MTPEMAIEFLRMLITMSLMVTLPVLLAAILVGVVISLLQAVTSIQEQTLSFAPKLFAVGAVIVMTAPWMIRQLMEFTIFFLSRIAEMTG
ncbi:MAG: flagellar biosynthetic protein FliQ [Verrucomicrobiae bacterium]